MSKDRDRPCPTASREASLGEPAKRHRQRLPYGDVPRHRIKTSQWSNLWAALGQAERLGLGPNWTLDIHYERGGLADPYLYASGCLHKLLCSSGIG